MKKKASGVVSRVDRYVAPKARPARAMPETVTQRKLFGHPGHAC